MIISADVVALSMMHGTELVLRMEGNTSGKSF
jgi:hypothetical protein